MKKTRVCPKCAGRDIHHAPCVMDRGEGNQAMCLAVRRSDAIHAHDIGQFEVYVCTACGYSEFYVLNPQELSEWPQED